MYSFSTVEEFSKLREPVRRRLSQLLSAGGEPMFVAVNEAVNNAIFHGNKRDNSKKVHLSITGFPDEVQVTIQDEGDGLMSSVQEANADSFRESGRGLEIIGLCVDNYYFKAPPNEMVLIKKITA